RLCGYHGCHASRGTIAGATSRTRGVSVSLGCGAAFERPTGPRRGQHDLDRVIPEAFPGIVYTWRLNPDGSYAEDGRYANGAPAQPTMSGHWSRQGGHMTLRQNNFGYVFDGDVSGRRYQGVLFQDGAK